MNRAPCVSLASSVAKFALIALFGGSALAADPASDKPLCISGVYPHLAVYNKQGDALAGECGIGAIVPWAGKLWLITYPPHMPKGSPDKLYAIDPDLKQETRPESVGGTHAARMIHRESNQLLIGPYFIDSAGKVRAVDVQKLVGRITGFGRHLSDPANKVYVYEMEGAVYEVDVHSLAVKKLFTRAAPGAHGKGAYTGQGRFIIANNGDKGPTIGQPAAEDPADPKDPEVAGALAEWDGKTWKVIERHPFTDVTGPGGIYGAPDDASPVWSIGWDKRSVILKLLDGGKWFTFRLPKASHAYDPKHGWYTEWPRIREVGGGKYMMDMHGMFYDFPGTFSATNTGGIAPIASHLRYIPDFCNWNGRLVLATDETTIMQNPMAGQPQSNLWFGTMEELKSFGPAAGWGGVWLNDPIKAGAPSDPFLINGFERRIIHLSHNAPGEVKMTLEIDAKGDGRWAEHATLAVPAKGYAYYIFPSNLAAQWVRVKADRDCVVTAYLHCSSTRALTLPSPGVPGEGNSGAMFRGLADVTDAAPSAGIIRPAAHNRNLQFLVNQPSASPTYLEVDENLHFVQPAENHADEVTTIASIRKDFAVDDASAIMMLGSQRYRLPKSDPAYDKPFAAGWPRGIRECESERYLMNICGTFYEMPREKGLPLIKPVCTHNKQIMDFCTWRGLLVLSGVKSGAAGDGHVFSSSDGKAALWFGAIDDLWKLGPPRGVGGPWKNTPVKAGVPSDAYLMTGYPSKRVELSHNAKEAVTITLEVDVDHTGWKKYQSFTLAPGQTLTHQFPDGFSAHWVRTVSDRDCAATAWFVYGPATSSPPPGE